MKTDPIISKPEHHAKGGNVKQGFAYNENQNEVQREEQEDALAWEVFDDDLLEPLTPEQIGERLWTAYNNLEDDFFKSPDSDTSGCTASTTIIKGDQLITATLADAAAFAVIYDENDKPLAVHRLNTRTHKPSNAEEKQRVLEAGGAIFFDRVLGNIAVSRAIGDIQFKASSLGASYNADLLIPNADINITSLASIPLNYKVQVITTCDGFTDASGRKKQAKEDHEELLLNFLKRMPPDKHSESDIADYLVHGVVSSFSTGDNVSVAVQTVKSAGQPANFNGMVGVYDGHGGTKAAHYVADNIGKELKKQFQLTNDAYLAQAHSIEKENKQYLRDNTNLKPFDLNTLPMAKTVQKSTEQAPAPKPISAQSRIKEALGKIQIPEYKGRKSSELDETLDVAEFKKQVMDLVREMRPSAEKQSSNYRLLAYLALLVTGVGIFAIVMDQISRKSETTGNRYLFLRSDEAKALDDVVDEVQNLGKGPGVK